MIRTLTTIARDLRYRSTDAERLFWSKVRAHRLFGHKFKRQQIIGAYIVDFFCPEPKLAIELDGGQHALSSDDRVRDEWLKSNGYEALRFWDNEVLTNIDGVLQVVVGRLERLPSPQPSPLERE